MVRLLLAILLWPALVNAQSVPPVVEAAPGTVSATLSWTAPTENADGTPLTDLAGYRIYVGIESGKYLSVIPLDDAGLVSYVVDGLSPDAVYFFAMTAWNSVGQESDFSNEARVTTGPLTATGDLMAYAIEEEEDGLLLHAVGTVREGTECDSTQQVNGKFVVPRESVTWFSAPFPVVVAQCGS